MSWKHLDTSMKIEMIEKKFPQRFFAQVELSRGSTAPFKNHQGGPDFNKAEKRGASGERNMYGLA